jgi:hypothetical protein
MNMRIPLVLCCSLSTWASTVWTSTTWADLGPAAAAWNAPVDVQLPAPMRSIVLRRDIDPNQWIRELGLTDATHRKLGNNHLVQIPMHDAQWDAAGLCDASGVKSCGTDACQSIQLSVKTEGADSESGVKASVRRKPPEPEDHAEVTDDGHGTCSSPLALVPPEAGTAGSAGQLNLQLDLARQENPRRATTPSSVQPSDRPTDPSSTAPSEPGTSPGSGLDPSPADITDPGSNADRGPQLTALGWGEFRASAPADSTEYELLVGSGCDSVTIPLDALTPAHMPDRVTAVVTANTAPAIAVRNGLQLLSTSTLASTSETLVVYLTTQSVADTLAGLALDADIVSVQPEYIYTTTASAASATDYSDPLARFNYGPVQTGAVQLHRAAQGELQTIAVIDTGVAVELPEFDGRIEYEDFTGEGWSADAHGTAVVGIIAAAADNALGSYGVAPQAKILALKACQPVAPGKLSAKCRTSSLVQALDAAIVREASVINMSLAGPPDELLARYVARAAANNQLIVAGSGNGGVNAKPAFPAALDGVLAVTAIDANKVGYADANRGDYIDVAAPGVDIITPAPDGSYPISSGTSWAAAHVSGIAALVRELVPLSNAAEVTGYLSGHTSDLGPAGRDPQFGFGLIDACSVADAATASAVSCAQQEPSE